MRNLRNTRHSKHHFQDRGTTNLSATAWDATNDSLILAFGPTADDPAITLKRLPDEASNGEDAISITSWDAPSPNPELPVDQILELHCFADTKTISLILAGGDIVVVREEPQPGEDPIEIVGSVDAGITAAVWSPDEELLAISTGAETLLFMTREFESIANISLSPEDLKVSNHVSVGWGKKETQFKGRGVAKTLRDPTVPEHVDEGTLSPLDDGIVTINWRGDGQYVAVNSILQTDTRRRIIRVYSREGILESVSEPVDGLEGAVSWKPSGQIIAGIQRQDTRTSVVFFERNGLRHGEFDLRLSQDEMNSFGSSISLSWNVDSTVLAVSMKDRIQLWTMGNYHWYLKQQIRLGGVSERNAGTLWHPEKPLHLSCRSISDLRVLSYRFEVCRGSVTPPNDLGIIAVIDGKKLKITPLRTANVPPPLAFDQFDLPGNAIDVAISEQGREIAILHEESVSLVECDYSSKPPSQAKMKSKIKLLTDIPTSHETNNNILEKSIQVPNCQSLFRRTDHDRIHYHDESPVYQENGTDTLSSNLDTSRTSETRWRSPSSDHITFELSETGVLHVQSTLQTLRIPSCTSFIITRTHLIYTTGQHLLKFVHLQDGELQIPADEPEKDERCRSIERGAKIVTVMPSAYSLVLQMPRGNLETIYPRALVLAGIRKSIDERDYKKAFLDCRSHRVDMNILHDHVPDQFMQDVELFVKQLKKVEFVDLFLSSLIEDDVSKTIYLNTLPPKEKAEVNEIVNGHTNHSSTVLKSKVNKICDAFLQVLQKQASKLQNVITAQICKNPPDLEAGLKLVSEIRCKQDEDSLEQAVEHVCFLADPNQLYDTALGLYDLDVALLIAQQSQKDPREYLPYLQSLHDFDILRRKFVIDNDLKRFQKAVLHLHAADSFEELKEYVIKHELYPTAMDIYRYDDARLSELMKLYADHLSSRNRFKEAGIAYEYISDHSSAYAAYRSVGMWQECLANAALVPLEANEMSTLAQDLSSGREEAKDFASAATIHIDYLEDLEGALQLFCKGYHFAEAMRQVSVRARPELLRTVIDPGLIEASATMTELFADMKQQLAAQVPRIQELRQKKTDDPMSFLDGIEGGDADIPDNLSLAPSDVTTSAGTFLTRYTNRTMGTLATNATRKTSKKRRQEERKRARGKKGTVYEEEYLVNSIARLIERLNEVGGDTARLIEGLMRRGMRERAVAIQAAMSELRSACEECIGEVFSPTSDTKKDVQEPTTENGVRPWGGQGVLWDALTSHRRETPTLKTFERLTLLG